MKKIIALLIATLLTLSACGKESADTTITVAAHINPMPTILELIKDDLAEEGYTLEIAAVNDNVQANTGLLNKEFDANFFQHKPFMEMFNEGNEGNLVAIQPVYDAIVGFYSKTLPAIDDLPEGAVVAIPSDPTNEARALLLLAQHGLIELTEGIGYKANSKDITANPMNLEFLKVSLLNLNSAYEEADLVFNYPAYIGKLGLTPQEDALLLESGDRHFAIQIVAREDNKDTDKIKALKKAITSQEVADFLNETLAGATVKAFEVE